MIKECLNKNIPTYLAPTTDLLDSKEGVLCLKDVITSTEFLESKSSLCAILGQDGDGKTVTLDIGKSGNVLIAGTSGSGKTICLNTIMTSLMYKATPDEVKFMVFDPKGVEYQEFSQVPHMLVDPIVSIEDSSFALDWLNIEIDRRYRLFDNSSVTNITDYNNKSQEKIPNIVVVFDEIAGYVISQPNEFVDKLATVLSRTDTMDVGIYFIVSTQRPTVDILPTRVKKLLMTKLAFKMLSGADSRVLLGKNGAETLNGYGDMLLVTKDKESTHLQCAYISYKNLSYILTYLKTNNRYYWTNDSSFEYFKKSKSSFELDPLAKDALMLFYKEGRVSASLIQARMSLGFPRASKIIHQLKLCGYITYYQGKGTLLISKDEFKERFLEDIDGQE